MTSTDTDKTAYGRWVSLCNANGWSLQEQVILLEGLILREGLLPDLADFAAHAALATREDAN